MEKIATYFLYAACVLAALVVMLFSYNYLDFSQGWFIVDSNLFDHFGSFFDGVIGALLTFSSVLYLVETFREQRKEGVERRFFELLRYNRELLMRLDNDVSKITSKNLFDYYFSSQKELSSEMWKFFPDYHPKLDMGGKESTYTALFDKEIHRLQVLHEMIMHGTKGFSVGKPIIDRIIGAKRADFVLYGNKDGEYRDVRYSEIPTITNLTNGYYRNIIHLVRFVNNNRLLSYDEKYEHIRTLRSLMSAEEQALLFFNAISEAGKAWGVGSENVNLDLVTKYNLVKNATPLITNVVIRVFFPNIELQGDNGISNDRKKLEQKYREWKPGKKRYGADFVRSSVNA
jgi:Putative phage abortive infection protein